MEAGPVTPTATIEEPTLDDHAARREALRALAALIGKEVFY